METYGYLAELEGLGFDENTSWIQALPIGKYNHPVHGELEITPERITRMANNVNAGVRGTMLDVDYEHKTTTEGTRASGWIISADDRGDKGLWVKVSWTPRAMQALKDGEYKYFSPEFADQWEHPKTGEKYDDVLFGGALTNRPFLKDILPINFSDYATDDDLQQFRDIATKEKKAHPDSDYAGKNRSYPIFKPEDVAAAVRRIGSAGPDNFDAATLKRNIIRIAKRKGAAFVAKLPDAWKASEEVEVDIVKLREALGLSDDVDEDAVVNEVKRLHEFHTKKATEEEKAQKFAELFPEEAKRLADLETSNRKLSVERKLSEWTKGEKIVPVKLHDQLAELRQKLNGEEADKFDEFMASLLKDGLVDTKEVGTDSKDGESRSDEPVVAFANEVKKFRDENKGVSYTEAVREVSKQRPDLAKEYLKAAPVYTSSGEGVQ